MRRATSDDAVKRHGAAPVNATTLRPRDRAACAAARIFGDSPLVLNSTMASPGVAPSFDLTGEHLVVPEVVGDGGQHRGVGGQREGGQSGSFALEPADKLRRQMLRFGRAAAVAGGEHLAAAVQRRGDQVGRSRDGTHISAQVLHRLSKRPLPFRQGSLDRVRRSGCRNRWLGLPRPEAELSPSGRCLALCRGDGGP
jgi:hypothetical protein